MNVVGIGETQPGIVCLPAQLQIPGRFQIGHVVQWDLDVCALRFVQLVAHRIPPSRVMDSIGPTIGQPERHMQAPVTRSDRIPHVVRHADPSL
mgnify:CR=1 FL=1